MLGNTTGNVSALKGSDGQNKNFKKIRKLILRWMNVSFRITEKTSSGYGLTINFARGDEVAWSTGLFFEHGLAGMLEASVYDSKDQVSTFLEAIFDAFRGDFEIVEVTNVFTDFVDLVGLIPSLAQIQAFYDPFEKSQFQNIC